MPSLIGNKPNQVPTNGDLGTMAFQDANTVKIDGGTAVLNTATVTNPQIDTEITDIRPSLLLDFAKTKTLDPRITFTRASTASFYDGKTVAKAEENLVLNSVLSGAVAGTPGTAPTNWSGVALGGSIDTVALGADGVSNVLTLTTSTNRQVYQQVVTVSANLKYIAQIALLSNANSLAINQLISWITIPAGSTITYLINGVSAIGSDIPTANSIIAAELNVSTTAGSGTVRFGLGCQSNVTGTVALTRPQVEQRSAPSAYTRTTTASITNYIPALQTAAANIPRFEHNPITGESLGLEIEEQRTNLLTYSDDLSNAAWTKSATTATSNTIVAPDGTLTGEKLVEDTANSSHRVNQSPTTTASTAHTFSVYLKAGERTFAMLYAGVTNTGFMVNLTTGATNTVAGITAPTSYSATSVGNGWYRCSMTFTSSGSASSAFVYLANSSTSYSYTGDGFSGIYIWGAQLEAGAFATSYIPTVASQVTRNRDIASITGTNFSSWYRADEGTLCIDIIGNMPNSLTGNRSIVAVSDGTYNNYIYIAKTSAAGTWTGTVTANNSLQASFSPTYTINQNTKLALAYVVNNINMAINGTALTNDNLALIPSVIDRLEFRDPTGDANGQPSSIIKKFAYYPKRLANTELQEMTL